MFLGGEEMLMNQKSIFCLGMEVFVQTLTIFCLVVNMKNGVCRSVGFESWSLEFWIHTIFSIFMPIVFISNLILMKVEFVPSSLNPILECCSFKNLTKNLLHKSLVQSQSWTGNLFIPVLIVGCTEWMAFMCLYKKKKTQSKLFSPLQQSKVGPRIPSLAMNSFLPP